MLSPSLALLETLFVLPLAASLPSSSGFSFPYPDIITLLLTPDIITLLQHCSNKLLQYLVCHSITQIDFSSQDSTQRNQHILGCFLLHNVASGAGTKRPRGVNGFVMY